jgi:hypothetical protein
MRDARARRGRSRIGCVLEYFTVMLRRRWQLFKPDIVEDGSCIFNQNVLCGAPKCAECWLHFHSDPVSAASCRSAAASGLVRGTGERCTRPSICPNARRQ